MAYNIVAGRDTLYTREIELTFKRHVMSAEHEDVAHREIGRHFFIDYIANLWYNILYDIAKG